MKRPEGMSCEEQLSSSGLSNLRKRRLRDNLIALYSFLRKRSGKGCADLFFLVSSDMMHRNGLKVNPQRFKVEAFIYQVVGQTLQEAS